MSYDGRSADAADAQRYLCAYHDAIGRIAAEVDPATRIEERPGLSIKLSALHPRYEIAQGQRVRAELLPRLADLCKAAAQAGIPLTIDAEEVDRLLLSLDLFERLHATSACRWDGWGRVRLPEARARRCDWLAAWRRKRAGAIMVRLVKGLLGHRDQPRKRRSSQIIPCTRARRRPTFHTWLGTRGRSASRQRGRLFAIRHTIHSAYILNAVRHIGFRIPEAAWHGRCAYVRSYRVRRRMPGLAPSAAIASPP